MKQSVVVIVFLLFNTFLFGQDLIQSGTEVTLNFEDGVTEYIKVKSVNPSDAQNLYATFGLLGFHIEGAGMIAPFGIYTNVLKFLTPDKSSCIDGQFFLSPLPVTSPRPVNYHLSVEYKRAFAQVNGIKKKLRINFRRSGDQDSYNTHTGSTVYTFRRARFNIPRLINYCWNAGIIINMLNEENGGYYYTSDSTQYSLSNQTKGIITLGLSMQRIISFDYSSDYLGTSKKSRISTTGFNFCYAPLITAELYNYVSGDPNKDLMNRFGGYFYFRENQCVKGKLSMSHDFSIGLMPGYHGRSFLLSYKFGIGFTK